MTMLMHDAILQERADAIRRDLLDEAAASRLAEKAAPKHRQRGDLLSPGCRRPAVRDRICRPSQPARSADRPAAFV